jgi:probable rRNA maturation factor
MALFATITAEETESGNSGHVNLILTDDHQMQDLNRQFRNIDHTTDVLAFNIDEPDESENTFGEIYISIPTAMKQAQQYGATNSQELLRLVCHGLLHLFGYDHRHNGEARKMKAREEHYLGQFGIPVGA